MKGLADANTELSDFLSQYGLNGKLDPSLLAQVKSSFKRYYTVLIWQPYFSRSKNWGATAKVRAQFNDFFTEAVSDLAQSLLIASQGMYKPANLILRSSLENYFRCCIIEEGKDVGSFKTVFDLIDRGVKQAKVAKSTPVGLLCFQQMRSEYTKLCKHVHTSDKLHMAHTNLLGLFPRYDATQAAHFFRSFTSVSLYITTMNCLMFRSQLFAMHHSNRDQIFDVLPRTTRRALSS